MRAAACGSEAGLTPTPLGARQIAKSDRWAASALVQRLGAAMRARAADPASDEAHNEVQRQVPRPRPHPLLEQTCWQRVAQAKFVASPAL